LSSKASFSSASHGPALPSLGARQSPRGRERAAAETLGELGMARALELADLEEAEEEDLEPLADGRRGRMRA
jgi:hypothetical protein